MSPHLTREQERSLFAAYRGNGDRRIEERLVRSQLPLVAKLARASSLGGADVDDLIQEGALGLLHAIRRFDPARGVRLSTYAAWWIRAFQYRYLMRNHRMVRIGTTEAERRIFIRLRSLRARLSAAGLDATPERIASLLRVDARTAAQVAQRMDARDLSLEASRGDGDGDAPLASRLAAAVAPADDLLAERQLLAVVREERERYRETLTSRRRELFDERWLRDDAPTLKSLGQRFGISRERTRQLEQAMLGELRRRVGARLSA